MMDDAQAGVLMGLMCAAGGLLFILGCMIAWNFVIYGTWHPYGHLQ